MTQPIKRLSLLALVLAAVGLSLTLVVTAHHSTAGASAVVATTPVPQIVPSGAATQALSLFKQQAVASDLPSSAPTDVAFRQAAVNVPSVRVYVGDRPGKDICVVGVFEISKAVVQSCGPESALSDRPTVASLASTTKPNLVAGVAPDGYTSVEVTSNDKTVTKADVSDNAYALTIPSPYASITLLKPDGSALQVVGN